jgi:phosphosulfolactate synthase
MGIKRKNGWELNMETPITGRLVKPRDKGLTMIIDKGLGLNALADLLEIGGEYIDFLKFSFGTSFVYPNQILKEKISMIKDAQIDVYPGGTLFEVSINKNKLIEYLYRARELGFTAIEISNGTIELPSKLRRKAIMKAHSLGYKVLTEVGKKDKNNALSLKEMIYQIKSDISNGAYKVIIEGRESGKGVSIYQGDGSITQEMFQGIINGINGNVDNLIWETPLKSQQAYLISELGPDVNLGNIDVDSVVALEALRRGLRGDTFKFTLNKYEDQSGVKAN